MAEKDKNTLPGLNVFADFIVGDKSADQKTEGISDNADNVYTNINPEDLQKQMDGIIDNKQDDIDNKTDDKKDDKVDDKIDDKKDDKIDDKVDDKKDDTKDDTKDDKTTKEDDLYESEISTFFANELTKKLNLDLGTDDLKVENVEEVLELMNEIINDNSKPTYSSDEVKDYDEFVKNGGSLKEFYNEIYSGKLDTEAIDIEKEYDQRAIVRENLLNQGYKEDRVKKMISRYEESETLKEEAEDALEMVVDANKAKAQSLLVEQKNYADEVKKQQQKFYRDVNNTIKDMSNIRGLPITDKQKRELLQYAFNPEEDGLSKYQKDYRSDVTNILESAYFAMNRKQKIADDAGKTRSSDAYKTLRDRIKAKGSKQDKITDDQKDDKLDRSSLGDFGKNIFFK